MVAVLHLISYIIPHCVIKMLVILNCNLSWFMTSIESRGAHKSGERWKHEGHEGFRQIWVSMSIITLCPMFWCVVIHCVETPLYPSFYMQSGVGFTRKIRDGYSLPDRYSISTCLFLQDLSLTYLF
jgi:hypothetical protein